MDPFNADWTAAENKAFEVALAEIGLNSPNWFEQLMARFPNKAPHHLRDHYMDLVADIQCIESGHYPIPIYSDPWAVSMDAGESSILQVPDSPQFSGIGSMPSRKISMSMPEKKAEVEVLLLPNDDDKEENLLEELLKDGSFETMDEWRMKEASRGQVVEQEIPILEFEEGLKILSPGIVEGDNKGLSLEAKQKEMISPEVTVEVPSGNQVLEEVNGVAIEKVVEQPETSASRKGKLWTKEEHRLFLTGLNIYGRGAWSKIAKNFVLTRTPTQVASHAQKYYERQTNPQQKRRHSILDITTPEIKKPHQTSMYNSVDNNSQTRVNNVNQPSSSSIPLLPLPMANSTQTVNYPQLSQLSSPEYLERNSNQQGFW